MAVKKKGVKLGKLVSLKSKKKATKKKTVKKKVVKKKIVKKKKTVKKKAIKKKLKLEMPLGFFGKMKKLFSKEKSAKLPDFKITTTPRLIILPEGNEKINVTYPLIEPFAYANIKWNPKTKEIIYSIIEPKLTKDEQKMYKDIVNGLLEILDIELSAIKVVEDAVDYLEEKIRKVIDEYGMKISKDNYTKIMYHIYRNFVGLNRIEPFMKDPYVEDVSCNGTDVNLYVVHKKYGSIKTNIVYNSSDELREFVVKLAERCGRFISYGEPLLDGSLPDGSRVQSSFASDVTTRGPTFTIRKFVAEPLTPISLVINNTVSTEMLSYLWLAIESGASTLIAGGAGTGKTTFLNALTMFIPPTAKIISIEDTRELNLPHDNWIPSVARAGFAKGYGEVTLFDLLKESFRQSPDYVIVGEVRGEEAYVMFQGMAAGFPSFGTMHAGKVEDLINRLETPPINLSASLLETLDVVVIMIHARHKGESARRVKEIVEIEAVDSKTGNARTNKVYGWLASHDTFEYRGYSWLMQELSKSRGVEMEKLRQEAVRRRKLLDWMVKKRITRFDEVANIFSDYSKNPDKVLATAGIKQ
ncbi:MAG: type II/IV secretion system ATPase subunit [Candidatus Aenigmarchaeota archaeon]|nr:type II/IV secretion system ATPase subunit [Candidatus Aenigmarchaeota archaeon]